MCAAPVEIKRGSARMLMLLWLGPTSASNIRLNSRPIFADPVLERCADRVLRGMSASPCPPCQRARSAAALQTPLPTGASFRCAIELDMPSFGDCPYEHKFALQYPFVKSVVDVSSTLTLLVPPHIHVLGAGPRQQPTHRSPKCRSVGCEVLRPCQTRPRECSGTRAPRSGRSWRG